MAGITTSTVLVSTAILSKTHSTARVVDGCAI
jgi:hypothetical protein